MAFDVNRIDACTMRGTGAGCVRSWSKCVAGKNRSEGSRKRRDGILTALINVGLALVKQYGLRQTENALIFYYLEIDAAFAKPVLKVFENFISNFLGIN